MGIQISVPSQGRTSFLVACVAVTLVSIGVCAQTASQAFANNIKGIQDYDESAIMRAGDSGNRAYIPYLSSILTSPPYRSPAEQQAVIALAKLGDAVQLKRLECDVLSNDPETINHIAGNVLPKVKGWFAIREYYFMLTQDAAYQKELKKPEYNTDALFGGVSPSHWAVRYLPEVVPRSPLTRISNLEDPRIPRLAKQWGNWIRENRRQLEHLRPQGQKGLQFSKTGCTPK